MKTLRFALLAAFACVAFTDLASGQNIYTWNNTSTNIGATASWTPTGFPGQNNSFDIAQFNVLGTFGTTQQFNPTFTDGPNAIDAIVNQTILGPTANFTGWSFEGSSTFAQTGITTYGPVTHSVNGLTIMGIPAGIIGGTNVPLNMRITNGSTLQLTGSTIVSETYGAAIVLDGGTLALDNSTTNTANRLPTATGLLFRGGTLDLKGNAAGTAFTVGALTGIDTTTGVNTIRLTPGGGPLSVNFANNGAGFSTRLSTFSVFRVEATSGVLGGPNANDPKMTFSGTPFLGANGLLANTANGATVGYFLATDANGTDFATWNATDGVKAAGASLTSSTVGGITAGSATDRVYFTPGSGTQTATGVIANGSLRITPTATGGVLDMGANNLETVALMLNGNRDFMISGTGLLGGGSIASTARYIHVNDPNTTLTTSLVIASGSGPTNIVGPGFVALNGTGSQNTLTGNRINLLGGTLRANNTQLGFATSSTNGVLVFSGGVLEIQGGGSFMRSLGTAGGNVRWDGGNGGFSAFGANAAVNIGGANASLTWGQTNFVGDGYALKFGSAQSNATLIWQNPIALDNGSPNYLLREINVTRGAGTAADKTVMIGVISGFANADLLKTGNGVLELSAGNSYQGNTLIHGGTLVLSGGATLGVGGSFTGNVVVGRGATLAGAGSINADEGKAVFVNPGGAIRGGNPTTDAERLGTLTINSNLTISSTASDSGILRVEASRTTANTANGSKIAVQGTGAFNLNPGAGNVFIIDLVPGVNPLQIGETYSLTLATVETAGNIQLNGMSVQNATIGESNYVLQSSSFAFTGVSLAVDEAGQNLNLSFTVAPVPEPATVLGIAAAGLVVLTRRRRAARFVG